MDDNRKQQIVSRLSGTRIGAIIACALGVEVGAVQRFTSKAIVTSDGYLQANFVDSEEVAHHSAFVGSYEELKENLRGALKFLNQAISLTDDEASIVFNAVAYDWIAVDYR